eukprot:scaffold23006_cov58-Phaeocystis_antarctica.AAC.3
MADNFSADSPSSAEALVSTLKVRVPPGHRRLGERHLHPSRALALALALYTIALALALALDALALTLAFALHPTALALAAALCACGSCAARCGRRSHLRQKLRLGRVRVRVRVRVKLGFEKLRLERMLVRSLCPLLDDALWSGLGERGCRRALGSHAEPRLVECAALRRLGLCSYALERCREHGHSAMRGDDREVLGGGRKGRIDA